MAPQGRRSRRAGRPAPQGCAAQAVRPFVAAVGRTASPAALLAPPLARRHGGGVAGIRRRRTPPLPDPRALRAGPSACGRRVTPSGTPSGHSTGFCGAHNVLIALSGSDTASLGARVGDAGGRFRFAPLKLGPDPLLAFIQFVACKFRRRKRSRRPARNTARVRSGPRRCQRRRRARSHGAQGSRRGERGGPRPGAAARTRRPRR